MKGIMETPVCMGTACWALGLDTDSHNTITHPKIYINGLVQGLEMELLQYCTEPSMLVLNVDHNVYRIDKN